MVVLDNEVRNAKGLGGRNELDGKRRQAASARVQAAGRRRRRWRGRCTGAGSLVLGFLGLLAEPLLGADEEAAGDCVPRVLGLIGLTDDEAEAGGVGLVELVCIVLRLEVHPHARGGGGVGVSVIAGVGGRCSLGKVGGVCGAGGCR